ncbi:SpoIIE family protein phosphatase [bacterium]|nr:SpoIIE family protein phosphatase [bacterium]
MSDKNYKILIVDDEKSIVFALEEALLDQGYEVETAFTAEQGLKSFAKSPANVVLSDLKMPGISGIELLSKIKEISSTAQVVIITAYGNFETAVEAVRLGAFDYIQKPFQIDNVKDIVKRAVAAGEKKLSADFLLNGKTEKIIRPESKPLDIQEKILPSGESVLGSISVDVKTVPKEGLGADFYDYFYLNENKVLITIGDIGEKGLNGSMVMIMVKSLIRAEAAHCHDPVGILTAVNKIIHDQGVHGIPITLFLGIVDIKEGVLEFVNAGHEKPLFFNHNDMSNSNMLGGNGIFLGLFDSIDLKVSTITYEHGDMFLLFTDGLIRLIEQSFNRQNPYSILKQWVQNVLPEKKYSLAQTLYSHFVSESNNLEDDVTVMSFYFGPVFCKEKEIRCAASYDSLVLIRSAAEDFLRAVQLSYSQRYKIISSIHEALLNILYFAYPEEKLSKNEVVVTFKIESGRLIITIEDFGAGFDMDSYREPDNATYEGLIQESGRGIFLMKQLMDAVHIDSIIGKGTKVVLEKNIKTPVLSA